MQIKFSYSQWNDGVLKVIWPMVFYFRDILFLIIIYFWVRDTNMRHWETIPLNYRAPGFGFFRSWLCKSVRLRKTVATLDCMNECSTVILATVATLLLALKLYAESTHGGLMLDYQTLGYLWLGTTSLMTVAIFNKIFFTVRGYVRYNFTTRGRSFALCVHQNNQSKPVPCTTSAPSGVASSETSTWANKEIITIYRNHRVFSGPCQVFASNRTSLLVFL